MNILKKLFTAAYALILGGCSSPTEAPITDAPKEMNKGQAWEDVLAYQYLDEDDRETKRALRVAKKNSRYQDYYTRFRLGNLCIFEGHSSPSRFVMDANGKRGYMGVLLGDPPRYAPMPNHELFEQFISALRADPEQLDPNIRYWAISILAGTDKPLSKEEMAESNCVEHFNIAPQDPTWHDEAGKLKITFYNYEQQGSKSPYLQFCTLTVDQAQKLDVSCDMVEVNEAPPSP